MKRNELILYISINNGEYIIYFLRIAFYYDTSSLVPTGQVWADPD